MSCKRVVFIALVSRVNEMLEMSNEEELNLDNTQGMMMSRINKIPVHENVQRTGIEILNQDNFFECHQVQSRVIAFKNDFQPWAHKQRLLKIISSWFTFWGYLGQEVTENFTIEPARPNATDAVFYMYMDGQTDRQMFQTERKSPHSTRLPKKCCRL